MYNFLSSAIPYIVGLIFLSTSLMIIMFIFNILSYAIGNYISKIRKQVYAHKKYPKTHTDPLILFEFLRIKQLLLCILIYLKENQKHNDNLHKEDNFSSAASHLLP